MAVGHSSETAGSFDQNTFRPIPEKVFCQKIRLFINYTRWFKYDRDDLCVNKSQFVPVIFEPPCMSKAITDNCHNIRLPAKLVHNEAPFQKPKVMGFTIIILLLLNSASVYRRACVANSTYVTLLGERPSSEAGSARGWRLSGATVRWGWLQRTEDKFRFGTAQHQWNSLLHLWLLPW
jgi:hypothetical protein